MSEATQEQPVPSIEQALAGIDLTDEQRAACVQALIDREDRVADVLRMAGAQFGLYPQIVAEVLAEVGIGTPVPEEARAMIRQQFLALMQQLQEEYLRQNPPTE